MGSIGTNRIRIVGIGVTSNAAQADGIGNVEEETIAVIVVETEMDVVGGTSVITKAASGTSDRVAGEATIGTTLAVIVAAMKEVVVVVVLVAAGMKDRCPSGCESWPERTLVSAVETATMDSSLVAEGTSVAAVTT